MAGRFKSPAIPKNPLSLKVPSNPKYKDVRPTIDTGASMTKYLERVKEIKSNYKYKKGELFKRIKVTSLVGLMIEIAEMNVTPTAEDDPEATTTATSAENASSRDAESSSSSSSTPEDNSQRRPPTPSSTVISTEGVSTRSSRSKMPSESSALSDDALYFPHPSSLRRSYDSSSLPSLRPPSSSSRSVSSLQGLVGGIGERSRIEEEAGGENKENASSPSVSSSPHLNPPYLLLDIREEDSFNSGHLRTAMNFPTSRLSRAFQFETKELRSFRNKEGKIIVVYDEDETMATKAATILVERGYDNVFMLSGGINVALKFFPEGLVFDACRAATRQPASPSSTPSSVNSVVLGADERTKLRSQLERAKLASSPAHRPTVKNCFDRRKTQMFGGQVKGKKAARSHARIY